MRRFAVHLRLALVALCAALGACADHGVLLEKPEHQFDDADHALAAKILANEDLIAVLSKAKAIIRTGFNAGDGYGEVWIRDFATFIELSCEVYDTAEIEKNLLMFFRFQGDDGNIIDGFIPEKKGSVGYRYIRKASVPGYLGHKNTVETDQESSLIHAVYKYVQATGDDAILAVQVDGRSVRERMGLALEFLLRERFAKEYGLLWGATTADWGDVQPEHEWGVVLDESSHRAIDIYDNAMFLLAVENYLSFVKEDKAATERWRRVHADVASSVRQHLWDAERQKFRPHVYLDGSPFPDDFDEAAIFYHGGTAVAIQAGLLSRDEIARSLEKMVENVRQSGAPSIGLTLYPPYPKGFFKNPSMAVPYSYQNGGDWTWFGARMIQTLIAHGFIAEAYREILPMVERVRKHDGFYEWYRKDGRPAGSGTFRGSAGVLGRAIQMLQGWAKSVTGDEPKATVALAAADAATLWKIGVSDNDTSDLALGPKGYTRFSVAFPSDPVYVVGRSDPRRDWPYTHPGPDDHWAEGRRHAFTVFFGIAQAPKTGDCRLTLDLVDTHAGAPPRLRVELNGHAVERQIPRGGGDASILGNPSAGKAHRLTLDIPARTLEAGLNELTITNLTGSWLLYDAVEFVAPAGTKLGAAAGTRMRSVRVDPWLTRRGRQLRQHVRLRVTHVGAPLDATLSTDPGGANRTGVRLEPGTQTLDFALPPVVKAESTTIYLATAEGALGHWTVERRPGREREPVDWVDPMLGTATSRWLLYPGPSMPFGMVKLSPDNQRQCWKAGYEYAIENIAGFSHLHSWTMGGLLTMPTVGELQTTPGPEGDPDAGYRSRFRHETEVAAAGYYAVTLDDYGVRAELTSTTRAGFQRYTYPASKTARILFDLETPTEYGYEVHDARIRQVGPREIEGYSKQQSGRYARWNEFTLHFVARLDKPFRTFGGWQGAKVVRDVKEIAGKGDIGAFVEFETAEGEAVGLQTGISLVSIEQARLNLDTEMAPFGWNFDAVRRHAHETWSRLLGKIEVEGGTPDQLRKFYTNLYRSYCARTIWSDVNGKYVDMCERVEQLKDPASPIFGCDAFWNTFWNLNQLWTLVNPDIASQWVRSLLEIYDRGGWLPKGPTGIEYSSIMVASHEIALIVSAYQKGIRDFDVEKAYRAMKHIQTTPGRAHECGGRVGNMQLASYMKYGYVPVEKGPVSNTLEYAYDDWCLAQMAKALGKTADHAEFLRRSRFYRNVFDPEVGYVRQKHQSGKWVEKFSAFSHHGFVEGNSWQYTWFVPHDVADLVELMGRDEFNRRLHKGLEDSRDNRFNATGDRMADFPINHGNQPNMQSSWLFNYSGKPWLTQKWTREILEVYYGVGPYDGYPGDEDQGQMGAWYVLSAMGIFAMDGGCSTRPIWEIASPIFDRVTIHLDQQYYPGRKFVIETRNNSRENVYIQSAELDGKPLNKPWFYHSELVDGGRLVLELGPEPNKKWGSAAEARPPRH